MENKYTPNDLKVLQSLPLDVKIRKTQLRIQEWYEQFNGNVYVARSGGKDSDVLGHIVTEMYPDVPHIFVNTGLEHDSVRKHGELVANEVLKPSMRFDDVVTKYGYPIISKEISQALHEIRVCKDKTKKTYLGRIAKFDGTNLTDDGERCQFNMEKWKFLLDAPFRISYMCCNIMKKNPAKQYEKLSSNKAIIGTMTQESRLRKTKWIKYGCNIFDHKRPTSQPLSFWTEQDILQYIKLYNLEIASAYGNIVYTDETETILTTTEESRTGCVFCMFGITYDTERFLRLNEREPKKYDYVMRGGKFDEQGMWIPHNGLGYKFIIDWLNEHGNCNIKY